MTQENSFVGRLSWWCLGLALIILGAFAWYVPAAHDRFRVIVKAKVPGFPGVVRGLPSIAFVGTAVALGVLVVSAQLRLKDRAAATVVHLLVIVVALVLFVAHREAMLGAVSNLWSASGQFAK